MKTQDPRWPKFWQNLIWFAATIIVLILLLQSFRAPIILLALWTVGLVWGSLLAYRLSQLLFTTDQIVVSEERSRAYLEQARDYQARINQAIEETTNAATQARLEGLAAQIETLSHAIETLVIRISHLRHNEVIRRDLQDVPKAIEDLETRLAAETDAGVRQGLERTLANRRRQLAALESLQNNIKQAETQVESTLSQLGAIYSQLLAGESTGHIAGYSRLSADVDEEVRLLQDHLEALREVKLGEA